MATISARNIWKPSLLFVDNSIILCSKNRDGFHIFLAEIVATFGLIFIIFATLKDSKTTIAACVATYITAGYWFTSSTSFANPAVALARTFTESFTGINYLNTPFYIMAELIGMLIAVFIVKKLFLQKNWKTLNSAIILN